MERHALNIESGVHELQDEAHAALHSGSGKPDGQLVED